MELSRNLESLKELGTTKYLDESLFTEEPEKVEVHYGKNHLQIGRTLNGRIYTIDLTEACRILGLGFTRCLPVNTKIRTQTGLVEIQNASEVLSYNFEENKIEIKKCTPHGRRFQKVVEILTSSGIINCSLNHKWYVFRDNKIQIIESKNLKSTDKFVQTYLGFLTEVRIISIKHLDKEVEMIDLEVRDNENFILENGIISKNSGKTWVMRAFTDRVVQTGKSAIMLNDVKNESNSSLKPLQPKFHNLLLEGEEPKPTKIVTLRPTFFKKTDPTLPKNNFWYSVDIRQLTKADFETLLNVHEMSSTQKISMEIIFDEIVKRFAENEDLEFSLDIINDIIDQIDELNDASKQSLKFKFRPLESSHFFDHEYQRSIAELLNKNYVPAINMEGYDGFGKGVFRYPDVVMSIVLREVIFARRKKKIRPIWIMFDEATRFIGNTQNGSIKDMVLQSVSLDTKYRIEYFFLSQTWNEVPDVIIKQAKYILVPHSADVTTIKEVLVNTGQVRNVQIANNDAMRLKRKMQKYPYSWIIINRMEGSLEIIRPLAPLSFHAESE